jgi:hypothetical protein
MKDKKKNRQERAKGKIDDFWVLSIEKECERIVRP